MQPQHIGGCRTMLPQIIRAQPPQERTGGIAAAATPIRTDAPTRDYGHAPGPIPSGTAKPRASRRRSRRSGTRQDKSAHARRRATHPAQSQAAQPSQERPGGEAAAAAPGRTKAPTRDDGPRTRPNPKRRSHLKSVPAAKPPQRHPAGQTRQRETKAKHPV